MFFALKIEKKSFPRPLSKKKEIYYFEKIKQKDETAKEVLIKHNLRLVVHIVKKYYSNMNEQEDLISIGTIGLIKAVKNFDHEKKIKFATYASKCIENEILMYFRHIKKNVNTVCFENSTNFNSSSALLYSKNQMEETDILDIVNLRYKSDILYKLINTVLTKRERYILIYRYGLYKTIPLTQQQTAKKLNISRSYISRLEKKAIIKLYKEFKKTL